MIVITETHIDYVRIVRDGNKLKDFPVTEEAEKYLKKIKKVKGARYEIVEI